MKFDMHVHTACSGHAVSSEETVIKAAKKLGIGVAITDHNTCKAWDKAAAFAKKQGVPLILGEEIKIFEGNAYIGEILGYFMQESATENRINSLGEITDRLRKQDALISVAHPFDMLRKPLLHGFRKLDEIRGRADAIEVFNSRMWFNSYNRKAEAFAAANKIGRTAGSDAHFPEEIGNATIEFRGGSMEEIRKEIKKGTGVVKGRLEFPTIHFYTQLAKFKLLKVR